MNESQEIAANIALELDPRTQRRFANSFDACARYVREQMPDETMTVIDNTAQALQQACRRAQPSMVNGFANHDTFNVVVTLDNEREYAAKINAGKPKWLAETARTSCRAWMRELGQPLSKAVIDWIDWVEVAEHFNAE